MAKKNLQGEKVVEGDRYEGKEKIKREIYDI